MTAAVTANYAPHHAAKTSRRVTPCAVRCYCKCRELLNCKLRAPLHRTPRYRSSFKFAKQLSFGRSVSACPKTCILRCFCAVYGPVHFAEHPLGGSAGLEYDCGHGPNGVPSGQELAAEGQDDQHTLAPELRERREPLGWSNVKPSGAHRDQPDRGRRVARGVAPRVR